MTYADSKSLVSDLVSVLEANGKRISVEFHQSFVVGALEELVTHLVCGLNPEQKVRSLIASQRRQLAAASSSAERERVTG